MPCFIGGSVAWKMSKHAKGLVAEAKRRGKYVHMGKVNGNRRYRHAEAIGCDSVDGTYLVYGPDINLPKLLGWVQDMKDQQPLFRLIES